jgi:NADH-quinone oxidoreductase subunit K
MDGHVVTFFVMALAAAEAAIGLAILVMIFRNRATVQADDLSAMRD